MTYMSYREIIEIDNINTNKNNDDLKGYPTTSISGKLPEILSGNIILLHNVSGRVSHYSISSASIARNRMIGY